MLNNLAYLLPASAGSNKPGLFGSMGFTKLPADDTERVALELDGEEAGAGAGDLTDISFWAEA